MQLSPFTWKKASTIFSIYAPTMTNLEEVKNKFYEVLHSVITTFSITNKFIILDDFNVRVGSYNISWNGVIANYGICFCNSNGLLLLLTCAKHALLITNIIFYIPTHNRTLWMAPSFETLASHSLYYSQEE